jgi:chromosome segregation ATPase
MQEELNPFTLEGQLDLAQRGITTKRPFTAHQCNRLQRRYADTMKRFQKAEAELSRALRKWDKLRATVRRQERDLDRIDLEYGGVTNG